MTVPTLKSIQAEFQAALLHPRTSAGGNGASLLEGDGPTRARRLAIYQHGYRDRLLECLEADFPALAALMGAELFDFFAASYIQARPSRSPSLYELSAGFAEFLIETQAHAPAGVDLALPVDLARLERARLVASRAQGPETSGHSTALGLDLLDLGTPTVPETVIPLALSHPLLDFVTAVECGEDAPVIPAPSPGFIATARLNFQVRLHTLEAWQFRLLQALKAGVDMQTAQLQAADESGLAGCDLQARLLAWLPSARLCGLLI